MPRRPRNGRVLALQALDDMLSKEGNIFKLRMALERKFKADPVGFFERFVIPLMPKTAEFKTITPGNSPQAFFQITMRPEEEAAVEQRTLPEIIDVESQEQMHDDA